MNVRSLLYLRGPWHLVLPTPTAVYSDVQTTVDYILMGVEAALTTTSCFTHEVSDLKTSDHLPLTASLVYSIVPVQDANDNDNVNVVSLIWPALIKAQNTEAFNVTTGLV